MTRLKGSQFWNLYYKWFLNQNQETKEIVTNVFKNGNYMSCYASKVRNI